MNRISDKDLIKLILKDNETDKKAADEISSMIDRELSKKHPRL